MIRIKSSFPYGFKIRSHADLQAALTTHIAKDAEFVLILDPHKAMFLRIRRDGQIELSFKDGDLYDMWNATIGVPDDEVFAALWRYRKALNEYFFPSDD